jgi:hypothetical protein
MSDSSHKRQDVIVDGEPRCLCPQCAEWDALHPGCVVNVWIDPSPASFSGPPDRAWVIEDGSWNLSECEYEVVKGGGMTVAHQVMLDGEVFSPSSCCGPGLTETWADYFHTLAQDVETILPMLPTDGVRITQGINRWPFDVGSVIHLPGDSPDLGWQVTMDGTLRSVADGPDSLLKDWPVGVVRERRLKVGQEIRQNLGEFVGSHISGPVGVASLSFPSPTRDREVA